MKDYFSSIADAIYNPGELSKLRKKIQGLQVIPDHLRLRKDSPCHEKGMHMQAKSAMKQRLAHEAA